MQSERAEGLERSERSGAGECFEPERPSADCVTCDWTRPLPAPAAARYRSIVRQVPIGIARTSLDERIVEANPHLCALLGHPPQSMRAISLCDLAHPDDRARHAELSARLRAGEIERFTAEQRLRRCDGQWIWVERTVTAARDGADEPPHLIQVIQDVTERKRTQAQLERLRRAREVLASCSRALVHATDEATMLAEVCRLAVASGGFKQAWIGLVTGERLRPVRVAAHAGYAPDAPPMSAPEVWAADGSYRGKMAQVVASGEPCIERDIFGDPRYVDQRAHAQRFGWSSSLTVPLAAEGRVLGAIEFNAREADAFDGDEITMLAELAADLSFAIAALRTRLGREQAEAQAREHERRYHETFDQAAVGIVHTSLDGRYLKVNRHFCEMLGYAEHELVGEPAARFTHPEDRAKGRDFRLSMWEGKLERVREQKRYLRQDGTVLWTERTVSTARDACGHPMYFIRVIEDITERMLSAQRRAMEHAVTRVLAEAASLQEAMPALIRTMCEACDWGYGAHWCWSEPEEALVRDAVWSGCELAFEADEELGWRQLRWRNSAGLVGAAWFEGRPRWIEDMRADAGFRRREAALRLGFLSALSFPVTADGVTIGVMEFLGREVRTPDEVLLQTVGSIGRQIGQFIQRKQAEQALRESEERYRDIFEASPLPMLVRDEATLAIVTVNQAAVEHYGYERSEFQRMTVRDLWDPSVREDFERDLRGEREIVRLKRRHRTKDGRTIEVEASGRAFELGGRRVWLTVLNDVTEHIRAERKLVHLAHYDVLTGLPNRVLFAERLRQTLSQARRNGWITGVMFLDVDRFKNINDTLGHDVGDQLLREVSERLAASVRESDTVGRLGGDEFAIVLANLATRDDAGLVAQKIMRMFHRPFRLSGSEIFVTSSIGITIYPDDATEQDALLRNADAAMYRAKEQGRNTFRYYTPELSARALRLLTLEGSLRRALERDEFLLHYQPKSAVASGAITGVEALLRWRHPERGLVPPAEFIPVLEETGLIVQASEWVLNAVCRQLARWREEGVPAVPVAVNLSAREFLAPDLARTIGRILQTHAIAPSLLELEITESSLMVNPDEAARTLEYLKTLGVGLAIDDFGTGYSSLSYLKRFPLDALKIDRSFVRDVTSDANDAAITLAVISMAHSLGLAVVAEGVENADQLAFLARHGCDQVQGYYLARPVCAESCTGMLRAAARLPLDVAG